MNAAKRLACSEIGSSIIVALLVLVVCFALGVVYFHEQGYLSW